MDADEEFILWPPMVVLRNARAGFDEEAGLWSGMGNTEDVKELVSCQHIKGKPRHAYGPEGHRGMTLLVFDATVPGYEEARLLAAKFEEKGRGRRAFGRVAGRRVRDGEQLLLYGYLASMPDLDVHNKHHKAGRVKGELKPYSWYLELACAAEKARADMAAILAEKGAREEQLRRGRAEVERLQSQVEGKDGAYGQREVEAEDRKKRLQEEIDAKQRAFEARRAETKAQIAELRRQLEEKEKTKQRSAAASWDGSTSTTSDTNVSQHA